MHDAFQPLVARVKPLGNITRKYLHAIERHGDAFLGRLEAAAVLANIHLDRTAPAVSEDFERIVAAGRDGDEKLLLLGTYFATQFLHQNARTLEQLAYDLTDQPGRLPAYANFLERNETQFSQLVSIYVQHVLRIVTPADAGPFVILNVGTPGHQDDIDMAVVHGGEGRRALIDRAVARLAGQCQRFASPLDNYFAAEVGAAGFCLSIDELYRSLNAGGIGFVLITELLRAEAVVGEASILERLRGEVMAEYFYRPSQNNDRHELYLRGILGESRSLLLRPPSADSLNPKDDALRLIVGLATAFKAIDGIRATQSGAILSEVSARRPSLRAPLAQMTKSLVFLETFWQISQLLVALDEDIAVAGRAAREDLEHIAAAMGYRDRGSIHAVDNLLVHYHEAVEDAHAAAAPLMDAVARHLTRRSRFSRWVRGKPPEDFAVKLAGVLVAATRAFRSVRFYDDLIAALSVPGGHALRAFVDSFARLPERACADLARHYAIWGCEAPFTFMTLVTLMSALDTQKQAATVVHILIDAWFDQLAASTEIEAVRAIARVFRAFPVLGNRFLFLLDAPRLARFDRILDVGIGSPEVAAARDGYRKLVQVHERTSRYVKRVVARITERHPVTVTSIADDQRLRTLAAGRLAASERHDSPMVQKALLGDFYDIEFVRIAMRTLRGAPIAYIRMLFAELTATYIERLFDLCYRQVEHEVGGYVSGRERIGVFLSGGNARGRPYDEDYDLIAVLDSNDAAAARFAERVIVVMNGQIARRGVIPQYRLAEWYGRFVISLDDLRALLERDDDHLFVDRCQLLGSHMLVGTRRVWSEMLERVMKPRVFDAPEPFVRLVRREVAGRRRAIRTISERSLHLKEDRGGLREIDLALAASKARHSIWDTPGADPFMELARLDPERAAAYRRLAAINDFLVAIRSAYRVAVAATATIEREFLDAPARILGCEARPGV
ncbi:MAG: hypothetical protein MUF51_03025, partial [Vicinamibacteria bacterium]|nr:hypothetical protein [Vicinamibacteria bacterium]